MSNKKIVLIEIVVLMLLITIIGIAVLIFNPNTPVSLITIK